MNETKEEKAINEPIYLTRGPLGYGDPDDKRLRKTERDIIIPKMIYEEAEKKCSDAFKVFLNCAKNAGVLVTFKCREENNARNECISLWLKNPDLIKETTDKYLDARAHYRRTGEAKIKYKSTIKMSAVPQGAFAAVKVKQILQNQKEYRKEEEKGRKKFWDNFFPNVIVLEQLPFNYSSKLMNSIWGLYNQYSVHNFKKNTDANDFTFNNHCM